MPLPRPILLFGSLLLPSMLFGQGTVLLVVGSDTGVWEGLNVNIQRNVIGSTLYTDPSRNATRVMEAAFRGGLADSYGTPMKVTWWMMAGNMFRSSVNTDVPTPSTLPVYLIKQHQGEGLRQWGDEISFHYHDWMWSDPDNDGVWHWNQAPSFADVVPEFDRTLAELLIEEDVFPVSFRSGWHAMDNAWQQRLDEVLPFSLHNDTPAKRADATEPVDNVYDWSRAPTAFVPFHPSPIDYQRPGPGRGWNARSRYLTAADSAFLARIFAVAATGVDQIICLWAHLPETDFLDNLQKVNRAAHAAASAYPTVPFRYCTAVEAMQRWLRTSDTTKPTISLSEHTEGAGISWIVETDEPIFQPAPVVAIKDRFEEHALLTLTQLAPGRWATSTVERSADLAEVAVAATDTAGNLTTFHKRYAPRDVLVDDRDPGYEELSGVWSSVALKGWGGSYRSSAVAAGDSAAVRWTAGIPASGLYSCFIRLPGVDRRSSHAHITAKNGTNFLDTVVTLDDQPGDAWLHVATLPLDPSSPLVIDVSSRASGSHVFPADVLRLTPLVKEKDVQCPELVEAGDLIVGETCTIAVPCRNGGIAPVSILSAHLVSTSGAPAEGLPASIPGMGTTLIRCGFIPTALGRFVDTVVVLTDDPRHPKLRVLVTGRVREYFALVDDGDTVGYRESGAWSFSVASAEGVTSRYAPGGGAHAATFSVLLSKPGTYEVQTIVPQTVNATGRARYLLRSNGSPVDSVFVDQNAGSGAWVSLMRADVSATTSLSLTVTDAQSPIISGRVLRADAARFQWVGESPATGIQSDVTSVSSARLGTAYPNPFNPVTIITFALARTGWVELRIHDALGREVALLVNGERGPGDHSVTWDASGFPSGAYFCALRSGGVQGTRKLVLLR